MRLISQVPQDLPICQLGEPEDVDHLPDSMRVLCGTTRKVLLSFGIFKFGPANAASLCSLREYVGDDGIVGPVYRDGNLDDTCLVLTF